MNMQYFYREKIEGLLFNERLFRYIYMLFVYFSSFCFVEPFFQILTNITMYWALILIVKRVYNKNGITKIYMHKWIMLFLGSGFLTVCIYYKDNFITNFYLMFHGAICLILFYGMHAIEEKEAIRKEVLQIIAIFVKISTLASLFGFIFLFTVIKIEAFGYRMGLNGIRFTGLYTHPNIAAFVSVIGVVCCHIIWKKSSLSNSNVKLVPDWVCYLGVILNVLTIFLSDSNATLLFLFLYFGVFLFWEKYKKNKKICTVFIIKMVIVLMVLGGSSLVVRSLCQDGVVILVEFIQEVQTGEQEDLTIGREEREDLSSGRIDSFTKAFLLLTKKPLLGVGKGNIIEYGEKYLTEGFRYFDLHNGYLTILLSCGIFGFVFFFGVLIMSIRIIIKGLIHIANQKKVNQNMVISIAAFFLGYCVYAMLERTFLFDVTFMVAVFWLFYGYLMVFIKDNK